jgi:cytochrome o ubiquinol oxidase subunit 3
MNAVTPRVDAAYPAAPVHHAPQETQAFGFWMYILSDLILFSALFATFAVQMRSFAGGPSGRDLFDLPYVAVETALLLLSSAGYGLAMLAVARRRSGRVLFWLAITFLLGLRFVLMEAHEFSGLVQAGAGPDRSRFLSAYFTLVGTHGTHVTFGLIWMLAMMFQVGLKGLSSPVRGRLMRLGLFWHFLDIV